MPGVVYAAGVRHAYNLAVAFRDEGLKAQAVSGETPKRELASILARYERGDIDVLINAQLLAEGWNSPRATVCVHLAPTASKRIYQQRVGRVTRRHPGKEAGLVVDFVHPATKHDDPVVTLHSLLDRDVYRGGAIVVGPVRRGRGRRVRVERRVLPVCPEPRAARRGLRARAVADRRRAPRLRRAARLGGARRARACRPTAGGARGRCCTSTATASCAGASSSPRCSATPTPRCACRRSPRSPPARDPDAFDTAIDIIGTWPREERREGAKIMLQAMVDKRIGRRDQANAWIWRIAEYTREVHEEYAVQRWPETKRLLGLLVNSSGAAHARNARRLVHAARKQDRRLAAALLAAALAHTPEAEEVLRGARTRMARKPPALARELLRNFPKRRARNSGKRKRKGTRVAAGTGPRQAVARETAAVAAGAPQETAESSVKAAASAREAVESAAARVRAASAAEPAVAEPAGGGKQNGRARRTTQPKVSRKAKAEAGRDGAAPQAAAQPEGEARKPSRAKPARTAAKTAKPAKATKPKAPKAKATKAKPPKAKAPKAKVPEG